MLKKILANVGYLMLTMLLGFGIYHFLLKLQIESNDGLGVSTEPFFAAVLPNDQGVKQALNQYKGQIIVVNFWATWCPPCREEMPELSNLYDEFKGKNVMVLGIAIDEPALVKSFNQTTPARYPIVVSEEEGMALANALGNNKGVLPYTLIINTHGVIVKTYFGRINHQMLASAIKELL